MAENFSDAAMAARDLGERLRDLMNHLRSQEDLVDDTAEKIAKMKKRMELMCLRMSFQFAGLWDGWTARGPSELAKALDTFPAEIWRKSGIIPAGRVLMLTATSKAVRHLLAKLEWPLEVRLHRFKFAVNLPSTIVRNISNLSRLCAITSMEFRAVPMFYALETMSRCTSLTKLDLSESEGYAFPQHLDPDKVSKHNGMRLMFELALPGEQVNSYMRKRVSRVIAPYALPPYKYELTQPLQLNGLLVLKLHYNNLRNEGALYLAGVMRACTKLEELCISRNNMTEKGLQYLCDIAERGNGFAACTNLTALDIHSNHFRPGLHVFGLLKNGLPRLRSLDVSDTGARSLRPPYEDIHNLGTMLLMSPMLTDLDVSMCRISSDEILQFGSDIQHLTHLTRLNISTNQLFDAGAESLLLDLSKCSKLISLNLSENGLTADGVRTLMRTILTLEPLSDLSWNDVITL